MATVELEGRVEEPVRDRGDRLLVWAACVFTAAVVIHNSDHLRRGADAVGLDVFWAGTAGVVVEVGVVVLACQRHRLAPLAAAVAGLSLAPAYALVHFLPARSWLSDSFTSGTDVSPLSWFAASFEVVAALVLGITGAVVLRQRGGLASVNDSTPDQRSVRSGFTHPAAALMLGANVIIVAWSLVQL